MEQVEKNIFVTSFGNSKALVSFKNSIDKANASVTETKIEIKDKSSSGKVVSWGKKNNYPQNVIEAVRKNGSASSGLRFLRKAHYGNGLFLYRNKITDSGKRQIEPVVLEEVEDIKVFFKENRTPRFLKEIISDLEWFSIAFPEYILSNNYEKIVKHSRQRTAWCRFEVSESGSIKKVYVSQKFGKEDSVDIDSEYVSTIDLIDSSMSASEVKEYCRKNKIKKFVRPIFYPLVDESYYPQSEWHSILKSGWLDVANSVPALKKSLFYHQMTIKFLIEIDERYYENIYRQQWSEMGFEKRQEIRKQTVDEIKEGLVGNENAGKSVNSMLLTDEQGKQYSAIKITSIDDKLKDGSYLPEAEAANSEVLFSLGVDPSLIGAGIPGGKLGAGSGSDKRVAFEILSSLKKYDRDFTLEAIEFIQEYNGWDDTIKFGFENVTITTLDVNPTGRQNTIS